MLYLTYNIKTDGLGGQYQRIISIIALAKKYEVEYLHNPIKEMEHLPNMSYLQSIEDYFQINNNFKKITDFTYDHILNMEHASEEHILNYKSIADRDKINILIKIGFPSKILDANPSIYELAMPKLREIKQKLILPYYSSEKTNIAIHIRRGDIHHIEKQIRYTPIEYFEKIIQSLTALIPNTNICIFTEITDENRDEFTRFENVQIVADEDILLTFEHLVRADILVMCKSSFSYIAGLYNENTVIYTNFWHSPMPTWKQIQ